MYVEQPELEITYDREEPVERELYQIFLNIWENSKAFLDYWKTYPLSGKEPLRSEVPREIQGTRSRKARSRASVHQRVLLHASHKTSVRQGR